MSRTVDGGSMSRVMICAVLPVILFAAAGCGGGGDGGGRLPAFAQSAPQQDGPSEAVQDDAWTAGLAVVLGTEALERASDGSALAVSVDLVVVDRFSEPVLSLTGADIVVTPIDCGWGGPRECVSDAAGNATGNFSAPGGAEAFELLFPAVSHPYLVSVVAERSDQVNDWEWRTPALKTFFDTPRGEDLVSLETVQTENGVPTHHVLGPFTSDGRVFLEAIDALSIPAGSPPGMVDSVMESIRRIAAFEGVQSETTRTVLILARQGLTPSEVNSVAAFAVLSGVHVGVVYVASSSWYGFSEASARTGGLSGGISDSRQHGMVMGAMHGLLAGAMPFYRMQFRLVADAGTFLSGGNAKVYLRLSVPAAESTANVVYAVLDVAIP